MMTAPEIIRLLDELVGPTEAYGDSALDKAVLSNVKTVIDISNWALDRLRIASLSRHRPEASMREIGETAFSALDEYRYWISAELSEET